MPYKDQDAQREYQRKWAAKKNREKGVPERKRSHTQEKKEYIQSRKNVPCMDCGFEGHFSQMDFDHVRGDKYANLSTMYNNSWDMIYDEIAKCEIVCANCHRLRTWHRSKA